MKAFAILTVAAVVTFAVCPLWIGVSLTIAAAAQGYELTEGQD